MGGNALKATNTRRYEKTEYFELATAIETKLLHFFPEIADIGVIKAYSEKSSFGDMDILYSTSHDTKLSVEKLKNLFSPNQLIVNGDVISFDVNELQIDLIHSNQNVYEYARKYFSFNDLGNLVGKLFHKFGLKHGHKGLTLPLRDGANEFAEIQVSVDHDTALRFVGLSPNRFNAGFDNLDQIFEFVSGSPFYNPDFYKLENLNHIAKIRDKKRATYNEFLKFGETYTGPRFTDFSRDKTVYLEKVFAIFPHAQIEFKKANEKYAAKKFLKTKFNGELVSSLTGFTGKQLGACMQHLKKQFMFSDEMLMFLPEEKISQNILDCSKDFE